MKEKNKRVNKRKPWYWTHFIIEAFCFYDDMSKKFHLIAGPFKTTKAFLRHLHSTNTKYKREKNTMYVDAVRPKKCKSPGRYNVSVCLGPPTCPYFGYAPVDKKEYKAAVKTMLKMENSN